MKYPMVLPDYFSCFLYLYVRLNFNSMNISDFCMGVLHTGLSASGNQREK